MRNPVQGWKVLLSVAWLVLLCSCASEKVDLQPTASPPDSVATQSSAAMLPRSSKEYELYSWKSGATWTFALITGTNRLKTLAEITAPENVEGDWVKITAVGVPELKAVLGRLPSGTQIFWHTARHLGSDALKSEPKLRRPPGRVIREVRATCEELGLDLQLSR